MSKLITMEIGTWLLFIIVITILVLILIWQYIKSAVKAGAKEAIEETLKIQKLTENTVNKTE